jgi:hypothetical protein
MLLSVQDHFCSNAHLENPPVPVAELRTATITALLPKDSPALPKWVTDAEAGNNRLDFFLVYKEWVPGSYMQMHAFGNRVGHGFLLSAPGQPDIHVRLNGTMDSNGDGKFQVFGARILPEDKPKLVPDTAYTLTPKNVSQTYRWVVAPGVTLTMPPK